MRDYEKEFKERVSYIKGLVESSHSGGIVFGNSGGKDSALVGILCKAACDNTLGVILPCSSKRNFGIDADDGRELAQQFGIESRTVDVTPIRQALIDQVSAVTELNTVALTNIAPRIRMATLYAIGAAENRLVAGTDNKSEIYMGYYTKWGDGAHDFNPISDLTATEVFEFLEYLKAPRSIIDKAPSAGLYEGQTDEDDMGVTYKAIDTYLETGVASDKDREIIERYHKRSEHKRKPISNFENSKK